VRKNGSVPTWKALAGFGALGPGPFTSSATAEFTPATRYHTLKNPKNRYDEKLAISVHGEKPELSSVVNGKVRQTLPACQEQRAEPQPLQRFNIPKKSSCPGMFYAAK
jgi:hypothetical protein